MIRSLVLTLTILAIIFLAANQPPPARMVEVPYCVVDFRAAGKDQFGVWHYGWGEGYGPCHLQDRFYNS